MPIYEFQCRKCHQEFEVFFRSSRKEKKVPCPQCGNSEADRLLSLFGLKSTSNHKDSLMGTSCSACPSEKRNACNQV